MRTDNNKSEHLYLPPVIDSVEPDKIKAFRLVSWLSSFIPRKKDFNFKNFLTIQNFIRLSSLLVFLIIHNKVVLVLKNNLKSFLEFFKKSKTVFRYALGFIIVRNAIFLALSLFLDRNPNAGLLNQFIFGFTKLWVTYFILESSLILTILEIISAWCRPEAKILLFSNFFLSVFDLVDAETLLSTCLVTSFYAPVKLMRML